MSGRFLCPSVRPSTKESVISSDHTKGLAEDSDPLLAGWLALSRLYQRNLNRSLAFDFLSSFLPPSPRSCIPPSIPLEGAASDDAILVRPSVRPSVSPIAPQTRTVISLLSCASYNWMTAFHAKTTHTRTQWNFQSSSSPSALAAAATATAARAGRGPRSNF